MKITILALTALMFSSLTASAQDDIRTETVRFSKGATGTTISDRIAGYEAVDYKIGAGSGQVMTVTLNSDNTSNYFNVVAPGETDVAMFVGSVSGNIFQGTLPDSGEYSIRVYLMRNAARRGETANYQLDVAIAAAGGRVSSETNSSGSQTSPSTPESMMATCRAEAARRFQLRQPDVETKYEGQRVDGTHAVNGTAYRSNGQDTFQCSFNADGTSIVQFIVN